MQQIVVCHVQLHGKVPFLLALVPLELFGDDDVVARFYHLFNNLFLRNKTPIYVGGHLIVGSRNHVEDFLLSLKWQFEIPIFGLMLDAFLLPDDVPPGILSSFFLLLWLVVLLTETAKNIDWVVEHFFVLLLFLCLEFLFTQAFR